MDRTPERKNAFLEAKSQRKFDKAVLDFTFSPASIPFAGRTPRTPMSAKAPLREDSGDLLNSIEQSSLSESFSGMTSSGYLNFEQCLTFLEGIRGELEVPWEPEDFSAFAQFHLQAVCPQSHIEQEIFTYEDLERIVSSIRAVDNHEFIVTRLFRQRDEATLALRKGMRLVWTKNGEIVHSQSERTDELIVLYHGSATGSRHTDAGRLQRIVQLAAGQVFGFIEMILGVPSLLTLTMESEGTVLMLPMDLFQNLLRSDETLLWNVMYETLTEIARISLFIQAAPFPKNIPEALPDLEPANDQASKAPISSNMSASQIIERIFGVTSLTVEEIRELRVITLGKGAPLYEKGSRAVAFWLLLEGDLDLPESLVSRVNGVRVIGEMGLLTRQDRARDVHTLSRCVLLRVSLAGLQMLVRKDNEVMWKLARPALSNVVSLLAQITVGFEHRIIKPGKQLYSVGQPSEHLYVLINGRLRILDPEGKFKHDISKPGEMVGEMSLLDGSHHTHSVVAVRDTELLVLDRDAFQAVLEQDPQTSVKNLFRTLNDRMTLAGSKFGHKPTRTKTVAILSTSALSHVDHFTELLFGAIQGYGHSVRLITGEMIRARFPAVKKVEDMLFSRGISYYVHNQEDHYDYVLCLADNSSKSVWTRWILRQVDLILVVGYCDDSPMPSLERDLGLYEGDNPHRPEVQLVVLHSSKEVLPSGTKRWLKHRKVARHHHLAIDHVTDFQRLARVIIGKSVGLVLSGGGARGVAHLGVIRALMESGVPIDLVCGTSMGSQMAGMLALEFSLPKIAQKLEEFYVRGYYRAIFWDLTLPIVSFMTGEAFGNRLKRLFGGEDICVEDAWLPYFAVSTNLSTRSAHVHDKGPLWMAARAASGLPILFPPVVTDEGVFMDGGLINNIPVDMARRAGCDIIIAVDVSTPGNLARTPNCTHMSGWKTFFNKITRGVAYSSAMELLLYLTQMVDEATRSDRQREADVVIRPEVEGFAMLEWSAESQLLLVQRGHSAALASLQNLKNELPHVWNTVANAVTYAPEHYAQYAIRSNNQWRRITLALMVFLGVWAASIWRETLRKWFRRLFSIGGRITI